MGNLVQDLQAAATSESMSVSGLLRKALMVASKLQVEEFEAWITKELEGYTDFVDIPEYRLTRGFLQYHNPYQGLQPIVIFAFSLP